MASLARVPNLAEISDTLLAGISASVGPLDHESTAVFKSQHVIIPTHVIAPMLQTLFQMLFLAAMHANASFALHLLSHAIICDWILENRPCAHIWPIAFYWPS